MAWFPTETDTPEGWSIPFLGLIVWLGFYAIQPHIDAMVSSTLYFLPRIVPGPTALHERGPALQGYLPASTTMPANACQLADLLDTRDRIHVVSDEMKADGNHIPLSLHYWSIRFIPGRMTRWKWLRRVNEGDRGQRPVLRRVNEGDRGQRPVLRRVNEWHHGQHPVPAVINIQDMIRALTPTDAILVLSFFITVCLVAFSIMRTDGPAVTGLVLISLHPVIMSSARRDRTAYNPRWRSMEQSIPIIIRTSEDALWVAMCDRLAKGAIFDGTTMDLGSSWTISRSDGAIYRCFGFLRTAFLLVPFVLFANATFVCQIAIAFSYILLTVLFCIVPPGIGPGEIKMSRIYHPLASDAHLPKPHQRRTEVQPSLARTVWYAIRLTRSATWIRSIDILPRNQAWGEWLREAERNMGSDDWPAEGEKRRLVDDDQFVYSVEEDSPHEAQEDRIDIEPVHESQW